MPETKTKLTDELAQETYDQLYIGQSLSLARCAHVLQVYPHELKAKWAGKRLRQGSDAQRAKHQQGQPWEWGEAEPVPEPAVMKIFVEPDGEMTLGEDLGLDIPDGDGQGYDNGHMPSPEAEPEEDPTAVLEAIAATDTAMGKAWANVGNLPAPAHHTRLAVATDPGPGRRAVPVDEFDALTPLREAETLLIPAPAMEMFAMALERSTISMILTDLRAEADPDINLIRGFLAAEYRKRGGN